MLGAFLASSGGITGTIVDPRLILSVALKIAATSIVISHNHPSGFIKPSQADIQLTEKIKNAGELLDIQLVDHLILTQEEYYSFADDGKI